MRFRSFVPLLFLSVLPLSAQRDLEAALKRGLIEAVVGHGAVSGAEERLVLEALNKRLRTAIWLQPDGSATSDCRLGTSKSTYKVEWKGFTVSGIRKQTVTEADKLNGITQRYFVTFGATASRSWNRSKNDWTEWHNGGHVAFPTGVSLEGSQGRLKVKSSQLAWFTSPAARRGTVEKAKPAFGDEGLPPGVTRRR